jgi:two-component system cell cycle sensor histidine kinase/response regulator CckA
MRPADIAVPASPSSYSAATEASAARTVLLVEDESCVRAVARRILERAGYDVVEARSGVEALMLVEDGTRAIDLLLTDVLLPDMSGRDVSALLRRRIPALRTVLMSGYTEEIVIAEHGPGGDAAFIQKPFTSAALTETLRHVLGPADPS